VLLEEIDDLQERVEELSVPFEQPMIELSAEEWQRIEQTLERGTEKIRALQAEIGQLKRDYRRCVAGGADVALMDRVLEAGKNLERIDSVIEILDSIVQPSGRATSQS
jgi:hypothetical protein